jgi:hypothetical protein
MSFIAQAQTSKETCTILANTYAKPSRGRINQVKSQFKQITKGSMGVSEFLQTIKARADEFAILGAPVDIEDLSERILEGLGAEYKELAKAVQARDTPISYMKNFSTLKHLSTIPTTLLKLIFMPLHISPIVPLLVHVPCHTPTIHLADTQAGTQPTHIIFDFLTLPHLDLIILATLRSHTLVFAKSAESKAIWLSIVPLKNSYMLQLLTTTLQDC